MRATPASIFRKIRAGCYEPAFRSLPRFLGVNLRALRPNGVLRSFRIAPVRYPWASLARIGSYMRYSGFSEMCSTRHFVRSAIRPKRRVDKL